MTRGSMMAKSGYRQTIYACFIGYIVQAIINNFAPLLFLAFQSEFGITLEKIAILTGINFGTQLLTDLVAAKFADKVGYRFAVITAHVFSALGLVGLAVFPKLFPSEYFGLVLAAAVYAVGGGLIEVLISPIVEACPGDRKEGAMSLLHSFYCWGHVGVVVASTLFFIYAGVENWRYLAVCWAVVPLLNIIVFAKAPIASLLNEGETGESTFSLFKKKQFWILVILMCAAGASEQSVSQWSSAYAESALLMPKAIGDVGGPLLFAAMMGASRLIYGKRSESIQLERAMALSAALCVLSYLLIALSPNPAVGFFGCALCGFAVGIAWPGAFSIAAKSIKSGGTLMFAFLALAGDLGCGGGPTFVGFISERFGNRLQAGILAAIAFPILWLAGLLLNQINAGRANAIKRP
jgi:fucose permease